MKQLFIKIRVDESEKTEWKSKAKSFGLNLSEFIRQAINKKKIHGKAETEAKKEMTRQVARIGSNLNQIARWANTYKSNAEALQVIVRLDAINEEIKKICT